MASKKKRVGKRTCVKLARELARTTGICAYCGRTKDEVQIQAAHIIPEEHHWTSFYLNNMIELCASHHKWNKDSWHKNTILMARWFDKTYPGVYDSLVMHEKNMIKLHGEIPDWNLALNKLKIIKKRRKEEQK